MWDQIYSHLGELKTYLPWVSFLAGMGGSLHCVGMCGGLVTASCEKSHDIVRYQVGRLLGYLLLGLFAGQLGSLLNFKSSSTTMQIIPGILVGVLFIFWGVRSFQGKKAELPTFGLSNKLYYFLWGKFVKGNTNFTKAFFIGLISIMLPCGLLYGVVIGTVALESTSSALVAMFFFWLGTVPAMVTAPGIVRKILRPLKSKLPKTYAMTLVTIGIVTISMRVVKLHAAHQVEKGSNAPTAVHRCH